MNRKRGRRAAGLLFLPAAVVSILLAPAPAGSSRVKDLALRNLEGEKVLLGEFISQGPVLLYFWATWCAPCRKMQAEISTLAKKHQNRLQVVGVNVGGLDSAKDIRRYARRYRIAFPLLLDANNETVKAFRVFAIPAFVLLDSGGQIRFQGSIPPADLESML